MSQRLQNDSYPKVSATMDALVGSQYFSSELGAALRRPGVADRAVLAMLRELELNTPIDCEVQVQAGYWGSREAMIRELTKNGRKISPVALDLMGKISYQQRPQPAVTIVMATGRELGFTSAVSDKQMKARALERGWKLCLAEHGPALCVRYGVKPAGAYLRIAMEPVMDSSGRPRVFDLSYIDSDRWLSTDNGDPNLTRPVDIRYAFCA